MQIMDEFAQLTFRDGSSRIGGMNIGTKILLIAAVIASFLSSLFTSPGPQEVLLSIATYWMFSIVLVGLKLLAMKLFSKRHYSMADAAGHAAGITFLVSVIAYFGRV